MTLKRSIWTSPDDLDENLTNLLHEAFILGGEL